ncbi:MAG TPA: two-component system response regulator OmpR [Aquabacterium sp.]|uniref:osmolarity response regulator transcription factor OmpR n=1 Tax=Aquabacterium sp. TaxID=1872578 RepID=UPI002E349EAD|nr:two-component system response regulator OmpR [Aquabacterium sp.]HEX5355741.1 two-component system response regulator OmpR [Aquabacterium sp.]
MNEAPRILIADDEAELRSLLQRYLGEQGMQVRAAADAAAAEKLLARERFDVLVLDVMMPGEDGLSLCRRLRAQGETVPILMLTARGDPVDRILGLEMGADDYLPKPFLPRELLARVQAMVRRQRLLGAHGGPLGEEPVLFGRFKLLAAQRRLLRDEEDVALSTVEFNLLHALVMNANRPLGRDRLIELTRGRDHEATDRSIDVQVMRLRRLIEADPASPRHIQTVWGVGYVFVPHPDKAGS